MPDSKYLVIAEDVREMIRTGRLKAGDKIPSISQLKDKHGFSYGSIRGAMLVLKTEGVVRGRQGEGVFVLESALTQAAANHVKARQDVSGRNARIGR